MLVKSILLTLATATLLACQSNAKTNISTEGNELPINSNNESPKKSSYNAVAYFASGCFWCVEAIFESVTGVIEVESGYSGGAEKNPTYELVSSGQSRHAEAVKVYYDSTTVSYETLLVVFFDSHNPETANQQGPDRGPQYRSAIFYQNNREKTATQNYINQLRKNQTYKNITTEVSLFDIFYKAEDYHQDYERNHPTNSYIRAVSIPRLNSFKAKHPELLKKSGH